MSVETLTLQRFHDRPSAGLRVPTLLAVMGIFLITEFTIESRFLKDAIFFLAALIAFDIYVYITSRGSLLSFFTPSVLLLNYIFLSMAIGAFGFYADAIVLPSMRIGSALWSHSIFANLFFVLVLATVIAICDYRPLRIEKYMPRPNVIMISILYGGLIATALVATLFIPREIGYAGQITAALFIPYVMMVSGLNRYAIRIVLYLMALIPLSIIFGHEKREVLFLLAPLALVELFGKNIQFNIRHVLTAGIVLPVLFFLILAMTVVRTPEIYQIQGPLDIPRAVATYMSDSEFVSYFLLNIEATYTYFHTVNAIELALSDVLAPLYGETYIKPLFLMVPREMVAWKPWSAVHHYTIIHDPIFRLDGGSWAVSFLAEAFMNFRLLGFCAAASIVAIFDYIFRRFILIDTPARVVLGAVKLYLLTCMMEFARGSGLEIALLYLVVVLVVSVPVMAVLGAYQARSTARA